FDVGDPYGISRSARHVDGAAQSFHHRFIIFCIHAGRYLFGVFGFDNLLLADGFDEVWPVIEAAVCNDRHDVGHLQGGDSHFALADRQGYIKARSPSFVSVMFRVVIGDGQQAILLARQVDTQLLRDANLHGRLAPERVGFGGGHVPIVDHAGIGVAEIGVAGALDGGDQWDGPAYVCTAHDGPAAAIAVTAGAVEYGAGLDNARLLGGEGTHHLEYRPWWVLGLYGAYKHRFVGVVQ